MKKFRICFNGKFFGFYNGETEDDAMKNCFHSAEYKSLAATLLERGVDEIRFSIMELPQTA